MYMYMYMYMSTVHVHVHVHEHCTCTCTCKETRQGKAAMPDNSSMCAPDGLLVHLDLIAESGKLIPMVLSLGGRGRGRGSRECEDSNTHSNTHRGIQRMSL